MSKISDCEFCMSSWLMYRTIVDNTKCFVDGIKDYHVLPPTDRCGVHNSDELEQALRQEVDRITKSGKTALALSGGIDSAVLAKMMPKGSVTYTFKCIVPGMEVVDESPQAARYAAECGLEHRIVEVYWEDMVKMAPVLMRHKGSPCHSIEVQIYKASLQAIKDGFDNFIFGESSDIVYGGLSGLLSKDWTIGQFVDRYSYVLPYHVLKHFELVIKPYIDSSKDGIVDAHKFINTTLFEEAINSYENACKVAGIKLYMPYSKTILSDPLDYKRVRAGENKYIVRELFNRLYPNWNIPTKTPMPRPLNEWMRDWEGPKRPEFWPHSTDEMTGDQKWYVYVLEQFLNMLDKGEYDKQ